MDLRGLIAEDNRKWWTLGAMCLSMFMTMLDSGVVNVALPSIQKDLHTTVDQLEWVVNGYTLSFAALLVTSGRPGDIFGRRLIFGRGAGVSRASGSPRECSVAWKGPVCASVLRFPGWRRASRLMCGGGLPLRR